MNEALKLAEQISELQGSMLAMECFVNSLAGVLPADSRPVAQALYAGATAAFRAALMNSTAPEATVNAFERDAQRVERLLGELAAGARSESG
jgi:succinate dehydrogenase/fumarate reductase flavoprotein subunit